MPQTVLSCHGSAPPCCYRAHEAYLIRFLGGGGKCASAGSGTPATHVSDPASLALAGTLQHQSFNGMKKHLWL